MQNSGTGQPLALLVDWATVAGAAGVAMAVLGGVHRSVHLIVLTSYPSWSDLLMISMSVVSKRST